MKKKVKEMDIVFLLDRSGSMSGMENDTIGGYNSYLDSQRKDNIKVTTILFDNQYEILNNRIDIKNVINLTNKEYFVIKLGSELLSFILLIIPTKGLTKKFVAL